MRQLIHLVGVVADDGAPARVCRFGAIEKNYCKTLRVCYTHGDARPPETEFRHKDYCKAALDPALEAGLCNAIEGDTRPPVLRKRRLTPTRPCGPVDAIGDSVAFDLCSREEGRIEFAFPPAFTPLTIEEKL